MPIRTASLASRLNRNGARLHLAMAAQARSSGADPRAADELKALLDERRALKEDRDRRRAAAGVPKAKPVRVAKEPKPAKAPKAAKPKAPKEAKPAKAAKAKLSRADTQAKKAANAEAAKKADRKSAKT